MMTTLFPKAKAAKPAPIQLNTITDAIVNCQRIPFDAQSALQNMLRDKRGGYTIIELLLCIFFVMIAVGGLVLLGTLIYVGLHFLGKVW